MVDLPAQLVGGVGDGVGCKIFLLGLAGLELLAEGGVEFDEGVDEDEGLGDLAF